MGLSLGAWPALLAQRAVTHHGGTPHLPIAAVGFFALLAVFVLPVVLGMRAEARRREMEHRERMRAIEMGRPIPGESGWWTPPRVAAGIGMGVPLGVFAISWIASLTVAGAAPFIWPSAGAVGVAAVICGTILAARLSGDAPARDRLAKPPVDPDVFDAAESHRW